MKLLSGPRQPFIGLTLAAAIGIFVADRLSPLNGAQLCYAAVAALFTGGVLLSWPRTVSTYVFTAVCFFLIHAVHSVDSPALRLSARLGSVPRPVSIKGSVVTEPRVGAEGTATFLVKLSELIIEEQTVKTNATVFVRWRGHVEFADEVFLFGMIQPVAGPRNPGEFDMRDYLARHDVRDALFVRYPEEGHVLAHHTGNPLLRAAQRSRTWLQATICRGLETAPDVQSFLSGIVLGLRHQATEDIEEPFQQTGTLHLFAVAGLHVGIVAELLWLLSQVLQLSRRWAAALIIPLLFFYAAVTGLHVSSVRAAIMSSVLLGAYFFERRPLPLNSLAAAAFFLFCCNTNELFATGFQLSFAVVGAIILLADPFSVIVRRWSAPDSFVPKSILSRPRKIWHAGLDRIGRAGAVSAAAWAGSLVLIAAYFDLVTPISLVANLVVVPVAFVIIAVALLSVIAAPMATWISVAFNNSNFLLARFVLSAVHLFAQIPAGHYYVAAPPLDRAVAHMTILDLGAGAAVHLAAGHQTWLLDCGAVRDYERTLRPYLHAAGINRLDGLLLTHGDSLHIGGALRLLGELPPRRLFDNGSPDHSSTHRQVVAEARRLRLSRAIAAAGDSIALADGINAFVLHPPRLALGGVADDDAVVISVTMPAGRILFMSDNGEPTEHALLRSGLDLRADILVKGQNHFSPSATDSFIDAVRPQLIVSTARPFPSYERISDEWANGVKARGIKLFRQDETGAVLLRFWERGWEAKAYATGEIFRRVSR